MKIKIACLNVQGCNDLAKRECVGRLFEDRGLDLLVILGLNQSYHGLSNRLELLLLENLMMTYLIQAMQTSLMT